MASSRPGTASSAASGLDSLVASRSGSPSLTTLRNSQRAPLASPPLSSTDRTPTATTHWNDAPASLNTSRPAGVGRKRRARNLLREHYTFGGGGSATKPDPLNPDSRSFDPRAYYDDLITSKTLPELLHRASELLIEIRELDGERQSLVYNHHHELVAASETIRKMRSSAESLDPSLDQLRSSFSSISQLCAFLAFEPPLSLSHQIPRSPSSTLPSGAPTPRASVFAPASTTRPQRAESTATVTPSGTEGGSGRLILEEEDLEPKEVLASSPEQEEDSDSEQPAAGTSEGGELGAAAGKNKRTPKLDPVRHLAPIVELPQTLRDLVASGGNGGGGGPGSAPSMGSGVGPGTRSRAGGGATRKASADLDDNDVPPSPSSTTSSPAPLTGDGLAQAERLWGRFESVLSAWTDAGVPGAREIAQECRSVLRSAGSRGIAPLRSGS